MLHINSDQLLNSIIAQQPAKVPYVVMFGSDKCLSCRTLKPIFENIHAQGGFDSSTKCLYVNLDKCANSAYTYKIESIPVFLVFKDTQPVLKKQFTQQGNKEEQLRQFLNDVSTIECSNSSCTWTPRAAQQQQQQQQPCIIS